MVKLPNLDDLKKMGANLLDSAKSVKVDDVVNKIKSQVSSMTAGQTADLKSLPEIFSAIQSVLNELAQAQKENADRIHNLQGQFTALKRLFETECRKAETPSTPEDKKPL